MELFVLVCISMMLVGIILFFIILFGNNIPKKLNLKKRKYKKYAVVIPARYESNVIEELLISLKPQIKNMSDIYIIVESKKDPTCEIAKKYKSNIFVINNYMHRKGYALDFAFKKLLKKKKYDLYFVFDADNVLKENYINEMLKTYEKGYDVGLGCRIGKNNINVVSVSSLLTFAMINEIGNRRANQVNGGYIVSGSGFYISNDLIKKLEGFPFFSLTEDYEFSLYLDANNISTHYNNDACFFDEQPTKLSVSIIQRNRWVKGYLNSRKMRLKDIKNDLPKILGIMPYIFMIASILLFLALQIFDICKLLLLDFLFFKHFSILTPVMAFTFTLLSVYILLIIFTIVLMILDKNYKSLPFKLKILTILYHPIFLATYIGCFYNAVSNKNIEWNKIEHNKKES